MKTTPSPIACPAPFAVFAQEVDADLPPLRQAIADVLRLPEAEAVPPLLEAARLPAEQNAQAEALALRLARALRSRKGSGLAGIVQNLLQEFSLSSQEGVALMCLAEALLRIPDAATRDALIRDKVAQGDWRAHLGKSPSPFVNAAAWGLLLTGKLVATNSEAGLLNALNRIIGKSGEPLVRKGVDMAMRLMGEQFVAGQTIDQALTNAQALEAQGFRHSYDMLGEAALTAADADAYFASYEAAIHAIGRAAQGRGIYEGPGISIKLSALHPRYVRAQRARVFAELYPKLEALVVLAREYDIGINIDAEESERLDLSLDLLEKLCFAPALAGWNGIGFVIQAYQKRCPKVVDFLVDLAKRCGKRLMVRLVKGAYWDSEIKRAQIEGQAGYPVYTRKAHTDLSYLACAQKLLAAPSEIFPQFATHNARTLAAIHALAGENYHPGQYEFQCLHGMGEPLYEEVVGPVGEGKLGRPCRIYAPVGSHETLLAYLVRRLLENGANTSFVNRVADLSLSLEELIADPVASVEAQAQAEGVAVGQPHPKIPLPEALYGNARRNSAGFDLNHEPALASLAATLQETAVGPLWAQAMVEGHPPVAETPAADWQPITNPARLDDVVGYARETPPKIIALAFDAAEAAGPGWANTPPAARAAVLERAADQLEAQMLALVGLLIREAGKTAANAVAEVREAVDFLRYYAMLAREQLGEGCAPLGTVVCISPWNFPLAIFTGQIAAALAAGNCVLAKPAEQTPLIAQEAVKILWQAGVPPGALALLPGDGETVGAALMADARVAGAMFTGSTAVARLLAGQLAGRLGKNGQPIPLIAETGGLNAMIVDSSALTEQVIVDVVASAFDSAGQRCSALRLLCVQEDAAERTLTMLKGAMQELKIADPAQISTDVGPVIDDSARYDIEKHIETMQNRGFVVEKHGFAAQEDQKSRENGVFVEPTLIEINSAADLQREVFGPVLHVLRFPRAKMGETIAAINAAGYGLTFGTHTRIDETIALVCEQAAAGNLYINRNMVGAVVGVQPFGGEGLSGTGPKAGGPLYLFRLLAQHPADAPTKLLARMAEQGATEAPRRAELRCAHEQLCAWLSVSPPYAEIARFATVCGERSPAGRLYDLPGPTGERNRYALLPRQKVLCLASCEADALRQLAAVLAVGSTALWPNDPMHQTLFADLPEAVRARIQLADKPLDEDFDAALFHGAAEALRNLSRQLAEKDGPIIGLQGFAPGGQEIVLERLLIERSISINTAAAGGNASLMTVG
ncbi:MAG: trifunctional transcriptional regulator/proline dehydrogenase/L-glutamate gamma-semialdehyde dehydrogenase [Zoogloeaceae bacterium]|jgi:RHH-type proline utilization regulon transcriptional repressor/proline dehydrogenase/delta 1-pyrroline-5-carboxylate dehydrogenase|nr:trifunctional transcriptional regulator/proline dehydrogenase/L-glutamate gamma-semialdehyde dehydrogenase [Zoogloeaceae bacterium]